MSETLNAPFPWFGGKRRVASLVWRRFGDVPNYVEPFAGSLAVLLGRETSPKIETVNDLDSYVSNFWRAVRAEPDAVADFADWPVNQTDLTARHQWLVNQVDFRERMLVDPDYYDVKIAGWWIWGLSQWFGQGWCDARPSRSIVMRKRPHISGLQGINARRVWRKMPYLGSAGMGLMSDGSTSKPIADLFAPLCERLRQVRVCCTDWTNVLTFCPTTNIGLTAVFLDPPYELGSRAPCYSTDGNISAAVRDWAVSAGSDPLFRIALCGYEGEHVMPADWTKVAWKATGGHSRNGGRGVANATRERIWFSPACITPQPGLFDALDIDSPDYDDAIELEVFD
jgi:hypothetical protein